MTDRPTPYLRYDAKVVREDGTFETWFVNAVNNIIDRVGGETYNAINGVINGAAQTQAAATAQINAANAAASAAIAASGSTETDQDYDDNMSVSSGTFTTFLTNTLNHAGGGNYAITASVVVLGAISVSSALVGGITMAGEWQIIENPNAHVLASGTFTAISNQSSEGGGITYYENTLAFTPDMPSGTSYGDNETGAVTIELQLRRTSGATDIVGLYGSLLTAWA